MGFINYFNKLFTKTRIKCCFFHFKECIYRHIQGFEWTQFYAEVGIFNTNIKFLSASTFVPIGDVIFAYELLLDTDYFISNEEFSSPFLNCFETTWIGERSRSSTGAQPIFAIELWNNHFEVLNDVARTNNCVEGCYGAFSNRVGQKHPPMVMNIIKATVEEQNITEILVEQGKTGEDICGP